VNTAKWITLASVLAVGCGDHGHTRDEADHGHAHDEGGHSHDEGEAAEDGHGHGHGHGGGIAVTHWTERTELFVEFDPLVVGQESAFAAHLTRLGDYRAVAEGTATVVLSGGGGPEETFAAPISDTPGIFRPVATPKHAGQRVVSLKLDSGELHTVHQLGSYSVYADASQVPEEPEEDDGGISFLKEQQWKMPFVVQEVQRHALHPGVRVFGRVQARPDGQAVVTSPSHGRLVSGSEGVSIGATVERDQILATLAPALDTGGDLASLQLAVDKATVARDHAQTELDRVTELKDQGAVSERRVLEVKLERDQAAAELNAAKRRVAQFKRLQRPGARRSKDIIEVRAPITGTVIELQATPGTFVDNGQTLFRIVNPDALRVHAFVPEADLAALADVKGAWVWLAEGRHEGAPSEPLRLGPESVVSTAAPVDEHTRAVEVLFALPSGTIARVGQTIDVRVLHGEAEESVAIPREAVVWDGGIPYAFVMLGGESFERRQLELGINDGPLVSVESGLTEAEKIVTVGADVVALAEAVPAEATHGHMH
jgi:RND family efflux transporter MFP subunit